MKAPLPDGRGSETRAEMRAQTHAATRSHTEPRPLGSGPVDDDTAAYILESRKCFEDLRQVSAQLAGLLVLAAAGSKSAGPHHPMLDAAEQLYLEAVEGIHSARVTARAERHHRCLLLAAAALRSALSAAHSSLEIDPVLIPLRASYGHLQRASNELPGFEMVAFDQACCGRRS